MRSSLKFKILILLSSICLGSGALIISVAINAFRNDKLAYIFENYTETLKNTSNLFQSEYSTAKNEIRLFMYQYGQNTNLKLDDQDFIDEKYTVDFVGIKQKVNSIEDFQTIQKKSYEKLFTTKILPSLRIIFAKFESNAAEAELIGNQIFLFDQQLEGENESKLLYSFKPRSLENFLKSEDDSLNFVVDANGNILKQNSLIETTRIENPFDDNIKKIAKESQFRISTQTITDSLKKRYLLTVSPLKVANLYLVKIIEEEKAFSILNTFLYKVILAFLFLSCFVIIISVLSATYLTKRLVLLSKFTKEISAGNFSHQIPVTGQDEISNLSVNFNKMSHEIVRLLDETSKKTRMEFELKTAQIVQSSVFPEPYKRIDSCEITGFYESASECGGDWWFHYENEENICVIIADATGHGVPAALLTSAARSAIELISMNQLTVDVAIQYLNRCIYSIAKEKIMMTCFMCYINKYNHKIKYINASHEPPILFRGKKALRKNDLIFLNDTMSPRLGESLNSVFEVSEIQFNPGDKLFLYSDGINDVIGENGKPIKERGMIELVLKSHSENTDLVEWKNDIAVKIMKNQKGKELVDDVSFVLVGYSPL